jgi:hypothetical protein
MYHKNNTEEPRWHLSSSVEATKKQLFSEVGGCGDALKSNSGQRFEETQKLCIRTEVGKQHLSAEPMVV